MDQIYEIAFAIAGAAAALVCVAKAFGWKWGEAAFDRAAKAAQFVLKFIPKKKLVEDEDDNEK